MDRECIGEPGVLRLLPDPLHKLEFGSLGVARQQIYLVEHQQHSAGRLDRLGQRSGWAADPRAEAKATPGMTIERRTCGAGGRAGRRGRPPRPPGGGGSVSV